ncbi:PA14 domain-containing protein [Ruegeria sp. R14_0]|uniref:PA14 domain-containing protein n=1 Tax=Ruegeria sp. R14_0 TaxID=2821100 RepID=UPI001ADA98B7|nr:PA14 domain-containing protein [Ruegeria sp. R14_0]MBO9447531.1 hypothetical protein [Ruegeria sp. R14_0]
MGNLDNNLSFHVQSAKSDSDDKEDIISHLSHSTPSANDDPTRSTLHTGEQACGKLEQQGKGEGAPAEQRVEIDIAQRSAGSLDSQAAVVAPVATHNRNAEASSVSDTETDIPLTASAPAVSISVAEQTQKTVSSPGQAPKVDVSPDRVPAAANSTEASTMQPPIAEDQNSAPEVLSLDNATVAENAQGAVIGTLSVVDPDAADTHRYDVSDDRFEIVDGLLQLKPGVTLNHEEAAQIDVDVTVTDAGGLSLTERFTVDVLEVNERPETLSLDNATVAENAQGAVIGTLSVVDPDAADTHRYDVSDDRFEVVNGQLQLKPGVTLNHEEAAQIDVDVTVTDAGGLSLTERFTVDVLDVNEGPEALSLDNATVAENAQGAVIGPLSVVDPDAADTHRYDVSDDRFEVVNGQLQLKPGVTLNHEEEAQIDVDVTVTDAGGLSLTERFTVDVLDVNEGPYSLALNNDPDNLIKHGSFEEFDVARGRWKGFETDDTGSWQNANGMEIWNQLGRVEASEGNQLLEMDHAHGVDSISQVIQTEGGQLYDLGLDLRERLAGGTDTVEVYWNGNLVAKLDPQSADWETFKLQVVGTGKDTLELREPQGENDSYGALIDNITLTAAEQTVAENISGAVVGQLSFDDPDLGDTHRFEVSDDRFEVVDNQLRLKPGVALDFEEAASVKVEVKVIDEGGLSLTESFTVNVADTAEMTFSTGFSAKYFDVDQRLSKLDDLDWSADPTHQEVMSEVNYSNSHDSFWNGGSKDTFGVEVKGNIEVEEGGTFTFFLGADDGAILVINGQPVVENDGEHGFRTRTGEIELEPGTHAIEIRYFENHGRAGLKLEWEGPGLDGRELVTAPALSEAQTVSGMPLAIEVDAGTLNLTDASKFELGDLPAGTLVEAGDTTFVADAHGTVELEGWQGGMLALTPPPEFCGTVEASLRHSTPTGENSSHNGVQTLTFEVNAATVTPPTAKMVGGFHASYFDTDTRLTKLDDIDWTAEPTHQEFVPEINYENSRDSFWDGGSKDTFGAKLEGQVTVEEGGSYSFFAGADDGVAVFINGERVITNDGLHGFRTRSCEIDLEPGTYDIEVRYFENYGRAGLKLEWEGPGTDGREILQADPQPSLSDTGTFEVAVELDQETDQAVVSLDGLPPGTLLISGEDSVIADGSPADLSGWDLGYLEISPPPGFEGTIEGEIIVTDTRFNGAKVTSETPFELDVGLAHIGAKGEEAELADTFAASSNTGTPAPWHMEQTGQDGDQDADVMAEAVLTQSGPEISCIQTEAYERIDW